MRRWGENDMRTATIQNAAWQADQAVALGQFRVRKKVPVPRCICTILLGRCACTILLGRVARCVSTLLLGR